MPQGIQIFSHWPCRSILIGLKGGAPNKQFNLTTRHGRLQVRAQRVRCRLTATR